MLAASLPDNSSQTDALIDACIQFLQENEFVSLQKVQQPGEKRAIQAFCKFWLILFSLFLYYNVWKIASLTYQLDFSKL